MPQVDDVKISMKGDDVGVVFKIRPNRDLELELSQAKLLELVQKLGLAHGLMQNGKPSPHLVGQEVKTVVRPHWRCQPDIERLGALISFQHPAFGPVGFSLSLDQARSLIQTIEKSCQVVEQGTTLSSSGSKLKN